VLDSKGSLAKLWIILAVSILLFLVAPLTARADVSRPEDDGIHVTLWVTGTISEADAFQFELLSSMFEHKTPWILLNSKGGDVTAAMKIGRIVRKYDGWTMINGDNKCYSSCALIYIAGVSRSIDGRGELGLHRPYFAAAPQSREAIQKQVPIMLTTLKNYVAEMGVTDNFYQSMVNTEPSAIMIYRAATIDKLVSASDPTNDEIGTANGARIYGITTSEYRKRSDEAATCWNGLVQRTPDCYSAIMWGLSESVYRERSAKVGRDCRFSAKQVFSDEQQAIIDKTPLKQKNDLPFVERLYTCQRNAMLGR
jgi:hypothetical protein